MKPDRSLRATTAEGGTLYWSASGVEPVKMNMAGVVHPAQWEAAEAARQEFLTGLPVHAVTLLKQAGFQDVQLKEPLKRQFTFRCLPPEKDWIDAHTTPGMYVRWLIAQDMVRAGVLDTVSPGLADAPLLNAAAVEALYGEAARIRLADLLAPPDPQDDADLTFMALVPPTEE